MNSGGSAREHKDVVGRMILLPTAILMLSRHSATVVTINYIASMNLGILPFSVAPHPAVKASVPRKFLISTVETLAGLISE